MRDGRGPERGSKEREYTMTHWIVRYLAELRRSNHLTPEDIAARLGMPKRRGAMKVLWWEIGMVKMPLEDAAAYGNLFGLQLAFQPAPRYYTPPKPAQITPAAIKAAPRTRARVPAGHQKWRDVA